MAAVPVRSPQEIGRIVYAVLPQLVCKNQRVPIDRQIVQLVELMIWKYRLFDTITSFQNTESRTRSTTVPLPHYMIHQRLALQHMFHMDTPAKALRAERRAVTRYASGAYSN
ncbi:hypothetical protein EVAR_65551_1 [Eumeta japonica]|uniref:Uncharacterized protein n=1 Tax=Eumeta variegata TaxID=151549 RepID=A0A4C1ZTJ9_EUMVA|nr:hypothetical protein EVAR_65551_1 [Eumeta japonica]